MVKWIILWLLFSSSLAAQDILVEASINQNQGAENLPLKGTITITHPQGIAVDANSFQLEKKPLAATLVQETKISGSLISIYEFELPAKQKGLYTLDPIQVQVGGKTYKSSATTYEVKAMKTSPPSNTAKSPLIFRLEAGIEGPTPFYSGQRAKLFYRIMYNRSVDLTYSALPLLHTQEFLKIGDEQIKDYEQDQLTYQEITQEIEASQPGTFHYAPSIIEGRAYSLNRLGQKVYEEGTLHAESPAVEIKVSPLPIENQPASFNGAIGTVEGKLELKSASKIALGDKILLDLTVSGLFNLEDVKLPNLSCQPGFSGFFILNPFPPLALTKDQTKHFQIELRPISLFIQAIPALELSSFNPQTAKYHIWRSQPIPLNIQPSPLVIKETFSPLSIPTDIEKINPLLPPLEIAGITVSPADLQSSWLYRPQMLWIIISLGLLLIYLQWHLHYKWLKVNEH